MDSLIAVTTYLRCQSLNEFCSNVADWKCIVIKWQCIKEISKTIDCPGDLNYNRTENCLLKRSLIPHNHIIKLSSSLHVNLPHLNNSKYIIMLKNLIIDISPFLNVIMLLLGVLVISILSKHACNKSHFFLGMLLFGFFMHQLYLSYYFI